MPRTKNRLQIWTEYAAVRSVYAAAGILPRGVSLSMGKLIADAGFAALGRLKKIGFTNLRLAFPDNTEKENEQILKASFRNLGRVLGDIATISRASGSEFLDIVSPEIDPLVREKYERFKAEKRGMIFVSGHMGNWELLLTAFSAVMEPINYLARPLDNPLLDEMTVRLRERFGNRRIDKSGSTMRVISKLARGEHIAMLADVNVQERAGVFVPFFGTDACTTSGPAIWALRTNSALLPISCVWDDAAGKYRLISGDFIEPESTGDAKADVLRITAEFTRSIESFIRAYPGQWLWIHRRWKTRPPGEPSVYQ